MWLLINIFMKVNTISIIGGGTAGFVSALILKKSFPSIDVTVIRSKDIGIIGVGEGSTEHWSEFMEFMGIDVRTLIRETDATFKSGIMFKGWGGPDYLQSIGDGFNVTYNGYPHMYGNKVSKNADPKELVSPLSWNSRANIWFLGQESCQVQQFHFNTHKLNQFLENLSLELGINVIDDEIILVDVDEKGIGTLHGKASSYNSDFYVDCTGFRRLLMNKLGCEWESYSKYLKMKSAIVFPTEEMSPLPMWTTAQAMDYGWLFRIPVQGRTGNGYIFDSDYITKDDAHNEVNKLFGREVEIAKHITFDPGALKDVWIKNCVAIGLSASFVEPLEASSIGTSIQQAVLLAENIVNYSDLNIKEYNKDCRDILENIRDFVVLHYLGKRNDTQFWRDVQQLEIPESLKDKLDKWQYSLPSEKDFASVTEKVLFSHFHYILIMHGLNMFNIDNIKYEYNMRVPYDKQLEAEQLTDESNNAPYVTVPHKVMLEALSTMRTWPNF